MPFPKTIAIDGPAASGKTTLGKKLADELGFLLLDTGVMYRAVTWQVLSQGIDPEDEAAVTAVAEGTEIDVRTPSVANGRSSDIYANGKDITWEIRQPEIDRNVSVVSAYPGVRHALVAMQRRIGERGNVVMVGRDIGTVVLPDADLKIYLDASVEERARRRYEEMIQRGESANLPDILRDMRRRDRIDSTRETSPLRAATDAIIVNSDHLDEDQVLAQVLNLVKEQASER